MGQGSSLCLVFALGLEWCTAGCKADLWLVKIKKKPNKQTIVGRVSLKKELVTFSGKRTPSFSETQNAQKIVKLQLVMLIVENVPSCPKFICFNIYECTHLLNSHSRMHNSITTSAKVKPPRELYFLKNCIARFWSWCGLEIVPKVQQFITTITNFNGVF